MTIRAAWGYLPMRTVGVRHRVSQAPAAAHGSRRRGGPCAEVVVLPAD